MDEFLKNYHKPVMLIQSIDGLNVKPDGIYIDLTFGAGGHAAEILRRLGANGTLYAFDQDIDSQVNIIDDPRMKWINHNFKFLTNHLRMYGLNQVDGILGDLGVSSHQLDSPLRGFSTRWDCELDMRMDTRRGLKATDILNTYDQAELQRIFTQYGELPNARKLADTILQEREYALFTTSKDFIGRIQTCIPVKKKFKYLAQLFQAIRIEINDELSALESVLNQSVNLIKSGGRLAIISYHSLEDRLVKHFMRSGNMEGKIEKDFYGNILCPWKLVNKKAITPTAIEVMENNRSRSAKLRIAERR